MYGTERRGHHVVAWAAVARGRGRVMVMAGGGGGVGQSGGDDSDDDNSSIVRALTSVRLPFLPPALPAFLGALADFLEGVLAILRVGVLSCVSWWVVDCLKIAFSFVKVAPFFSILIGPEKVGFLVQILGECVKRAGSKLFLPPAIPIAPRA